MQIVIKLYYNKNNPRFSQPNLERNIRMLAKLRLELSTDDASFGIYQSSNLQGVIMENIDASYAKTLHEQGLKPYSQYIDTADGKKIWNISTLNEESYENIISPLLSADFKEFTITKKDIKVKILKKELETKEKKELLDKFYNGESRHYLNIEFITPTSFKSNGGYMFFPDLYYVYQSLMNKYSAFSSMEMYDKDTLGQLIEHSQIVQYKLRTAYFPLEGTKIPAFKGEISIKITGTDTMARYARLLAEFGEYSGVGIKTAIGMGAIRIKEREDKK